MYPTRAILSHVATVAALCAASSLQAQTAVSTGSISAFSSGIGVGTAGAGNAVQAPGTQASTTQGSAGNPLSSGYGAASRTQHSGPTAQTTEGISVTSDGKTAQTGAAPAVKDVTADQIEFQRFVLEGTGKALPLFGYNLFAQPGQYAPVLSAPVPGSYVLGPGDELLLQTFGLVDVAERLVLDREGKVTIPKVGPLVLAGMPFSEAEKAITAHLGKVYTNFTLSLTMGRVRSLEVFVVGHPQPGCRLGAHNV